ncbi:reverse transcriptase domain-containing protein [Pseudoalteromonas sp. KG3]|uniref:reverse transcriptase domain-containing protein n=1 Tax=unclassified Pseudoalteromonas TaxID=194690 RepID=UPI00265A44B1|nr:reverse transcriptase domain-containing protein [Pseudoalteromonas sp. KG3]WKD23281.1 reverse transcriptase domain-containing protein [Pseudoalteromonas sp. KG3]
MSDYDLFKSRFNEQSLKDIYLSYIHFTPSTGVDGISANDRYDFMAEINLILKKVYAGGYKFSRYKEKLISKGVEKYPRVISIPTVRDRLVLKALHLFLQDIFPENSSSLIPQIMLDKIKNDVKNPNFKSFIKIDIKNFYPSIRHELLLNKAFNKIKSKEARDLINKALVNPTGKKVNVCGVPQGLSISNILAEMYVSEIDNTYIKLAKTSYNRYVDDILIFSEGEMPLQLLNSVISDFDTLELECHPYDEIGSKTIIDNLDKSFDFLGYWIEKRKLTVKKESIWRIENSLAKIINAHKYVKNAKSYITENKLNLRITGCIYEGKRRGWLFYYSQMEDETILYKLDATVKTLLKQTKLNAIIIPKKFSKAYKECSRDVIKNHKYIINFDGYSLSEKKELLSNYMDVEVIKTLSNDIVHSLFTKRVRHLIKDLEEDIRNNS